MHVPWTHHDQAGEVREADADEVGVCVHVAVVNLSRQRQGIVRSIMQLSLKS